uniref:Uncharacterized protein n=1 Tax=Ditylenchus dipsaci TaxID=166011 RepID=A0A915D902_9BILA
MVQENGEVEARFKKDERGRLQHRSRFFKGYTNVNISEEETITDLTAYRENHEASTSPTPEVREKEYLETQRILWCSTQKMKRTTKISRITASVVIIQSRSEIYTTRGLKS